METVKDFDATHKTISDSLINNIRAASNLASQDIGFHRSAYPHIAATLNQETRRALRQTEKLLRNTAINSGEDGVALPNVKALNSQWRSLCDITDTLFERAGGCLDEFSGFARTIRNSGHDANAHSPPTQSHTLPQQNNQNAEVSKPQAQFLTRPFNHETRIFRPFLTQKPHGSISLSSSLRKEQNDEGIEQYCHPYEEEIRAYTFPDNVTTKRIPIKHDPLGQKSATFVDTEEQMLEMVEQLKHSTEVAVDLEHHDWRTYVGIVSLMQISTRDQDWIVDTLKPWRRKLELLNEIFADPSILKVFHGAQMDIIWLQRDLGLYVVGLFDTHMAARVLNYPSKSLAYLLKRFANFDAQKQYQTADWRTRPLPAEMLHYARSDTHFLLYIYDCMRNELIDQAAKEQRDCVNEVLRLSKTYALQRYEHAFYNDTVHARRNGWASALGRSNHYLSQEQLAVFARLHRWRDIVARTEDESINYIMSAASLMSIARSVPENTNQLFSASSPITAVIRNRAEEILAVIHKARTEAADMPSMQCLLDAQLGKVSTTETASHLKSTRSTDTPPAVLLRTTQSKLWGQVPAHSVLNLDRTPCNRQSSYRIHLEVTKPVSSLTASDADFREDNNNQDLTHQRVASQGASTASQVLRGKRKLPDSGPEEPVVDNRRLPINDQDIEDPHTRIEKTKISKRARKKAEKKSKEPTPATQAQIITPHEQSSPVLHRPSELGQKPAPPPTKKLPRTEDGPRAASKRRLPDKGKSATFKN